jgi:hypothetical protein
MGNKDGSIHFPDTNFAIFPGQGVQLDSFFGVIQRIRDDEAIVFFPDGECVVPICELRRISSDRSPETHDQVDADSEEAAEAVDDEVEEFHEMI